MNTTLDGIRHDQYATRVRRLRRMVRQTASLVSPGRKVKERLHSFWACDFEKRVILWTPISPIPGEEFIDGDTALWVIAHEAGHLEHTGTWTNPDGIKKNDQQYHRWVNTIEDVRMERLVAKDFPGFGSIRKERLNHVMRDLHAPKISEYNALGQAEISIFARDCGFDLDGFDLDDKVREWIERRWDALEKIIDSAPSTDDLQRLAYPFYKELLSLTKRGKDADMSDDIQESADEADGMGESLPFISIGGDSEGRSSGQEVIQILIDENEDAREEHYEAIGEGEAIANAFGYGDDSICAGDPGTHAGTGSSPVIDRNGLNRWNDSVARNRSTINLLAHQLKMVLVANAQERWRGSQRRGVFDGRKAWKTSYGNNRVFRRQQDVGGHNYVVGIMPDVSYSMDYVEKASGAPILDPVVIIAEACEKAGIEWFVVAWDDMVKAVKPVRMKLDNNTRARLGNAIHPSGGTTEPVMMVEVENQLRNATPGSVPILFTITDGDTNGIDEVEEILREMTLKMGIHDISIYLGNSGKRPRHHATNLVASGIGEMVSEITSSLRRIVRRKSSE